MRITGIFILTAALGVMASCAGSDPAHSDQALADASREELAQAISERDRLLALVKDISESVSRIKELENIVTVTSKGESAGQRRQLLADIARVHQTLTARRKQLAELEAELKESSTYSEGLQQTIDALLAQTDLQTREIETLRGQLSEANERIGSLNTRVDSLNTTVLSVEGQRDSAREVSRTLADELNTCFYVVASRRELKEHNIIESGFLRKTRLMPDDFDRGFFIISDKRSLDRLDTGAKKARLLTNHPTDSYNMVTTPEGTCGIVITDPAGFWSLTNYLVVQKD